MEELKKTKYILWLNNGIEWTPVAFKTIEEARMYIKYTRYNWLITEGTVDYKIIEK